MKKSIFHVGTSSENKSLFHKSHAAKAWETGKPSRRMEAEISRIGNDGCEIRVHEVLSKGEVRNRLYRLGDIDEFMHKVLENLARDKKWRALFSLVDFFKIDL
jgi:hypothetical protein